MSIQHGPKLRTDAKADPGQTGERVQQIVNEIDWIEETYRARLQAQTVARMRFIASAASYTIPLDLRVNPASRRINCGDHRQRLDARRMHYVRAVAGSAAQPV
jgi:hypothetical protein